MIVAIDPSINELGWAVLFEKGPMVTTPLKDYGTIRAPQVLKSSSDEARMSWMIQQVESVIIEAVDPNLWKDFCTLVIERPQLWGAYKSVASSHSGSLFQLTLLVGALWNWGNEKFHEAVLVPVSTWKGQLPKEVVEKRMSEKYQVAFRTSHEADAVGLADYYQEKIKCQGQGCF
jgi:hypothetical protein